MFDFYELLGFGIWSSSELSIKDSIKCAIFKDWICCFIEDVGL